VRMVRSLRASRSRTTKRAIATPATRRRRRSPTTPSSAGPARCGRPAGR
jgi:hypothetical protein